MWIKKRVATEWDMAWFCNRCDKMIYWKTKGWVNSSYPFSAYCDDCKKILERSEKL